jgi:glycosyltransferase involved in cell wall biosynthesis
MKVAFISPQYPNISVTGGSLYSYHLSHALHKNCDLTVFIPDINSEKLNDGIHYELIRIRNKSALRITSFIQGVSKKIDLEEFDLVHVNVFGGLLLDRLDVLTFHHTPDTLKAYIHAVPVYLEGIKAKGIITVSEDSKKSLSKSIWFDKEKILVIPNGINPIFLQKKRDDSKIKRLKDKYGLERKQVILYINSNFTTRKNFPLMIETMKYLKRKKNDAHLIMIVKNQYRNFCLKLLEENNVDDVVFLVSDLSDDELVNHYHLCDFLAMPSTREGFGFPLIEAVALNKPFVSLNTGVAPELEKQGFGYVVSSDTDFKNKCLEMLSDPIRFIKGKTFVENNYSWDTCVKKYIDIYKWLER